MIAVRMNSNGQSQAAGSTIAAGGAPGAASGSTEEYNGTSWKVGSYLITHRSCLPSFVTDGTGGLMIGGYDGLNDTEEYAGSGIYKSLKICAVTGSQA